MNKYLIGLIICILLFLIGFTWCHHTKPVEPENKVDSIIAVNESIQTQINHIDTILYNINLNYATQYTVILNQSADSDYQFFTNYLQRYCNNHDSATKTN